MAESVPVTVASMCSWSSSAFISKFQEPVPPQHFLEMLVVMNSPSALHLLIPIRVCFEKLRWGPVWWSSGSSPTMRWDPIWALSCCWVPRGNRGPGLWAVLIHRAGRTCTLPSAGRRPERSSMLVLFCQRRSTWCFI